HRRQRREGHDQPASAEARRPAGDRDRPARRLPDQPMRPRLPAPTIRLRLTLVYGGLFTLSAAALLAITFVLVNHQYTGSFFISSGRQAVVSVESAGVTSSLPAPKPGATNTQTFFGPRKVALAAAKGQS